MSYVKSMGEVEAHFHMCEFISENDSHGITVVTCEITYIVMWGIVEKNEKNAKECLVMDIQDVEIDATMWHNSSGNLACDMRLLIWTYDLQLKTW